MSLNNLHQSKQYILGNDENNRQVLVYTFTDMLIKMLWIRD